MPKITLDISDARYAALTATAELHLPEGTPEEYLLNNVNIWCDSYAQTVETVAAQVYKDRAEQAEAAKKAAEEREAAAKAAAKAAKEAVEVEKAQLQEALQKSLDAAEEKA